jgi:UDP-N-acetyl-2-amino-2-deoxyglucuronate dehydrogenase
MLTNGSSKNFALIGAAGYVAPRHMEAIKKTGGVLRAAFDPSDSVGIIDRHFPGARFFVEFERFAEHIDELRRGGDQIGFVGICSPNYLHKSHASFAMRADADAICEKPLVLEPSDIDHLAQLEKFTGRKIHTILQLRLHPSIIALRNRVCADKSGRVYDVELTYVTSRGNWYYSSWKGDEAKSGGIATNIGVHFFDMLSFVFGPPQTNFVHHRAMDCAAGYLEYERARVRWFLSINRRDMNGNEGVAQRSMTISGDELFDFSKGFEDLHTVSYEEIVAGRGFSLSDVRSAIETVAAIRRAPLEPDEGEQHPALHSVLCDTARYAHGWPV